MQGRARPHGSSLPRELKEALLDACDLEDSLLLGSILRKQSMQCGTIRGARDNEGTKRTSGRNQFLLRQDHGARMRRQGSPFPSLILRTHVHSGLECSYGASSGIACRLHPVDDRPFRT